MSLADEAELNARRERHSDLCAHINAALDMLDESDCGMGPKMRAELKLRLAETKALLMLNSPR